MIELLQLPRNLAGELERLVASIGSDPSVKTIILFGSTALGTRNEESDIDLLVLIDDSGNFEPLTSVKIRLNALGQISFPLDVIVETVTAFEERKPFPTLERKIAREGKVIYAA